MIKAVTALAPKSPCPNNNKFNTPNPKMGLSNDQTDLLIIALKDHGIPLKYTEVESAFINEKEAPENEKWVMEHLSHDTLLSREELTLYKTLKTTGSLQNIIHEADANADRPFLDEDLRKAIDSLNASTAMIQKQTHILSSQYDNLDKELRREGERGVRRGIGIEHLRQRSRSERQSTAAASNELSQEVGTGLKIELENTAVDSKKILSTLAAWLKEDDRVLVGLQQLGSGIGPTTGDATAVKWTAELSTILAHCLAEEIQCRLDRVYLENLRVGQFKTKQNFNGTWDEALIALEGELESLYPEIDILAEMYTKQQYTTPISRALQNHHNQLHIDSHKKLNYILDLIAEMTLSTERLTKSLQDRESFCGILETFNTTYRTKVGDQFSSRPVPRREDFKRRSIQPMPAFTPSTKRIDSLSESHALAAVLRRAGLPSESVSQPEGENAGINVLFGARNHMVGCLQNYCIAADAPLVSEMISSDRASQLLSSSLNVNSHVKTLLTNDIHETELSDLQQKLEHVQEGIQLLDLGVISQRDRSREMFVERWGLT
ncbi:hypothetical protein BDV26DRAFT_291249 [Aspergillus bertholletiae]|uniref:Uncharacterized protein n=1 Tax=Aspergillus bertholletiae TaxID=1226010 RepID=A0A5N7BCM3_9EURO|nr:hypothetical protein BDV26DRAFT_291249 [Aspergillus bertholletiae]